MLKDIKNKIIYALPAIILSAFLVTIVVFAFNEPTGAPPTNNVPAPLNVGKDGQSKEGGLFLNSSGAAEVGLIVGGPSVIGTEYVQDEKELKEWRSLVLTKRRYDNIASLGFQTGSKYRGAFDFEGDNGILKWWLWNGNKWLNPIQFHENAVVFDRRLQLGNITTAEWFNDSIPGFNEPAQFSDTFLFVPGYTGAENSDLRLYILDNSNDRFSIWGDSCGGGDCGNLSKASLAHFFDAAGNAFHKGNLISFGGISATKGISGAQLKVSGRIGTNGFDPNSGYLPGWGGGIHTWDIQADGSINTNNLCIRGDCRSSWPAGGSSSSGPIKWVWTYTGSNPSQTITVPEGVTKLIIQPTARMWIPPHDHHGYIIEAKFKATIFRQPSTYILYEYADLMVAGPSGNWGKIGIQASTQGMIDVRPGDTVYLNAGKEIYKWDWSSSKESGFCTSSVWFGTAKCDDYELVAEFKNYVIYGI